MPTMEEMRSLADEIVRSYEDRVAGIAELKQAEAERKSAVSTQLKELDAAHAAMSTQLGADLAKDRADLAKDEEERLGEARALKQELINGVAERKSAVADHLTELDSTRAAMSKELKADLAKVRAAMSKELKADLAKVRPALEKEDRKRQSEAKEFMGELGRAVAEGKAATQALIRDFGEIQAGARDEWHKLADIMQSKRGGVAVAVKLPVEDIAEITPETAALREQVFEYLANHPDGTRLVDLAKEFGIARIQIAKTVKNLMDENKVEKRDLLYFAI